MVPYTKLDSTAAVAQAFQLRGLNFMKYLIGTGACVGLIGKEIIFIIICFINSKVSSTRNGSIGVSQC